MSKHHFLIFLVGITGLAMAQEQQKPVENTNVVDVQAKKDQVEKSLASASNSPGAAVDNGSFQLGAEDIVMVMVFDEPKFSGPHIVRPDGKITIPLVGDIDAVGITPNQLAKNIREKLADIIKDPQVTVSVTQVNSKKYFVQGEVGRPGQFPLIVPTTVMDALSNTGGFREFAKRNKIIILRKGQRLKFNYNEVIKGKKLEQNIYLESGDYIIVQ